MRFLAPLLLAAPLLASLVKEPRMPPVPYLAPAPCVVPLSKDAHADCMDLVVLEDRDARDGRTIKLPVVRFHSRSSKPEADPVVFTVGGPGNSTVRDVRSGSDFKSLDDRDFIIFEQRGSEYAQPQLACPEFNAAETFASEHNLTFEQAGTIQLAAAHRCYHRLSGAGVHLSAYNTTAIADDVADLRSALGVAKLNLMGLSYSTAIDMEVVRRHPGIVRSVVLDSVLPLDAHYDEVADANVLRTLHAIFDGCAVDPNCSRTYPNLSSVFRSLVERLNGRPIYVTLRSTTGQPIRYAVSGRNAVEAIYGVGLQSADLVPDVPGVVWQAYLHNYSPLLKWVQQNLGSPPYSYGARLSVICHDWYPFERQQRIEGQASHYPELGGMNAADFPKYVCDAWPVGSAPPTFSEPVRSSAPVLVFAGTFDPNTPPQWGQHLRQTLPQSYFIEFPAATHDAALDTLCGLALAAAFFDNPTAQPNESCLWKRRAPEWQR